MGTVLEPWPGRVGWCYVFVSLDSLCRWQVQVSVYCARWIPVVVVVRLSVWVSRLEIVEFPDDVCRSVP